MIFKTVADEVVIYKVVEKTSSSAVMKGLKGPISL